MRPFLGPQKKRREKSDLPHCLHAPAIANSGGSSAALWSSIPSVESSTDMAAPDNFPCDGIIADGFGRCPFLRNINEPTLFAFSSLSSIKFPSLARGARGPIFEDGPSFDNAFRLFHGHDGVIPLSGRQGKAPEKSDDTSEASKGSNAVFNPLAASAATISLSSFGASGPFSFDGFMKNFDMNEAKGKKSGRDKQPKNNSTQGQAHEALGNEWLSSGNCPIAKSYRAVSGVLPLVSKFLKPPAGMKYKCPPAVVAARAALARTAFAKSLRPRPLPTKLLSIGLLGMAANVPLGVWREHTEKFSPSWFVAVHAAVPFIAMMRKAVNMPKYAIAFTIAASVLGQVIGSRAERARLASIKENNDTLAIHGIGKARDGPLATNNPEHNYIKVPPPNLGTKVHDIFMKDDYLDAEAKRNIQLDSLSYQCAKLAWDTEEVKVNKAPPCELVKAF